MNCSGSPIEKAEHAELISEEFSHNDLYVKREDLLPFSFGGNKARIGAAYIKDAKAKGCDAMLVYGSASSNMCRVLAAMCRSEGMFCRILSAADINGRYETTFNSLLFGACGFEVTVCRRNEVGLQVGKIMNELRGKGYKPYYIFDDDNITAAMSAYRDAYFEILSCGTCFDFIFLPVGTGITFSGIMCGRIEALTSDNAEYRNFAEKSSIIGVTVSRTAEAELDIVNKYMRMYCEACPSEPPWHDNIEIYEGGRLGGYGIYNDNVLEICRKAYYAAGIGLDPIYSGKAMRGMINYINENSISGKNILFIHTGSAPLFFEKAEEIFK